MSRYGCLIMIGVHLGCGSDGGPGGPGESGEASTGQGSTGVAEGDSTSGSSAETGEPGDASSSTGMPGSDSSTGESMPPGGCLDPRPLACDGTDLVVERGGWVVDGACSVGALRVQGDACLAVALSSGDALTVGGDFTVAGDASVVIDGGTLRIANPDSEAYSLTLHDAATMALSNAEIVTQDGGSSDSIFMRAHAYDQSSFAASNVVLDEQTSWLLFDAHDDSSVELADVDHIPTELYVYDRSRVEMVGGHIGLWLNYNTGSSAVTLPDQTSGPFDWVVDGTTGSEAEWSVTIEDAQPGIGINAWPGSEVTVLGTGAPETGELTMGYFAAGDETLSGLDVGLIASASVGGRVQLQNVQLGPIAWQVYVLEGDAVVIEDSIVNELGVVGSANVTVRDSTLQLALIAALADDVFLTIEDSTVWNQLLQANGSATVVLENCDVHGTELQAGSPETSIAVVGGSFHENPPGCTPESMVDIETGQPNCNPFNAPGPPTATGPGAVTCSGTANCSF